MMLAVVTLVSLVLLQTSSGVVQTCNVKSDCGAHECCYHAYLSMIVKRQIKQFPLLNHLKGVCRPLAKTGQVCDFMHGACGCEAGSKCTAGNLQHLDGGIAVKRQMLGGFSATCVRDMSV